MAPAPWDAKADRDLLLTIIEHGELKGVKWPLIAGSMAQQGYSFSTEAGRQDLQKIRKESKNGSASKNGKSPTKDATPKTPKQNGSKSANGSFAMGNDDDEEEFGSALKRKRVKKEENGYHNGVNGHDAPLFKMENLDDQPIDLEREELYQV